jgi:hypothetical protein
MLRINREEFEADIENDPEDGDHMVCTVSVRQAMRRYPG